MLTVLLLCLLDSILEANKHLRADIARFLTARLQVQWAVAAGPVCAGPSTAAPGLSPWLLFLRAGHLHPFFSSWDFFLSSPAGTNAGFHVFSRLPQVICSHTAFTCERAGMVRDTCTPLCCWKMAVTWLENHRTCRAEHLVLKRNL